MTFGVNALDWTNIGRKLQTNMAETVGEALTLPAESSVLSPFAYYDSETGTVLTTYSAYLDTTSTPAEVVTVKTGEDGGNVVVDVTPLTLLYNAVDADGNAIITSDASAEGVEFDDQGVAIPLPLDSSEYTDNLQTVFDAAIDTDTSWSPTYILTSSTDGNGTDFESIEEVTNSDSTSWVRLKQRNGTETIYYFLPYSSDAEYTTFIDTIPATFTFSDDFGVFTAGTEVTESSTPVAFASTVEATSLDSARLSSTYESTLADLNTAYEALLSPSTDDGSTDDSDDDGADTETSAFERAIASVQIWVSDNLATPIGEYKYYLLGGVGLLTFIYLYRVMNRKTASQPDTIGDMLDKALGSGKEVEG